MLLLEKNFLNYIESQKYFKAEMGELNGNASVKLASRNN